MPRNPDRAPRIVERTVKTIAAVQGASGALVQRVFGNLIERWRPAYRVVGVLEEGYGRADRMRGAGHLKSIADGRRFPIFQTLGSGSNACQVDAVGATSACSAVQRDIAAGCDLVVLSKFGRLESERQGLMPALLSALELSVPVLIYVPIKFEQAWRQFAHPSFVVLPPEDAAIEHWWRGVKRDADQTHSSRRPAT
jgi:hypothetical protein